ncbi:MAG: hypothetical protein VB008_01810, partial [Candidatus Elulimicrobiales bacterium]|nr:hypothetical protein [Candidatus Elulimicrobiales bacterium]
MAVFLVFSIINFFSFGAKAATLSSWNSFSVKLYCGINNIFNINTEKCDQYLPIVEQPQPNNSPVNSDNLEPNLNNNQTVSTTNNPTISNNTNTNTANTPSFPTQTPIPPFPSTQTIVKTEYISLIGPMGPVGPMGPMGPKGEKGDTVYVNTSPSTFTYVPVAST